MRDLKIYSAYNRKFVFDSHVFCLDVYTYIFLNAILKGNMCYRVADIHTRRVKIIVKYYHHYSSCITNILINIICYIECVNEIILNLLISLSHPLSHNFVITNNK